ncbi:hypothetical protein B0H11DRAFT_2276744 [Mycena galericulata]|nr:hypothetical protein B0H11DRAFT_2276744 [Mycena galericulata]
MSSDSENDDEGSRPQRSKPARRSRDDVSGNEQLAERTRNPAQRKPSEKASLTNKENLVATQQKLLAAEKAFKKLKKRCAVLENDKSQGGPGDGDDDLESEEKSDEETVAFTSSITPLGRLPVAAAPPPAPLRKTNKSKATEPPKISSRAFKSLPELTVEEREEVNNEDFSLPSPVPGDAFAMDLEPSGDELAHTGTSPRPQPPAPEGHGRSRGTVSGHKRKHASESSSAPPAKRATPKPKEPKFREGFVVISRVKPKAADYEPVVEALLLRTCAEYSARIVARKSFPPASLQLEWARECWNNAGRAAQEKERYALTDRMAKLITKRGSHIRGKVVDSHRALFASNYDFQRTGSKGAIAANKLKAQALLDGASFHYKDPASRTGFAQNAILAAARHHTIFKNKHSLAAVFRSYFDPIPAPYLALDFAVLEHLTMEWTTGVLVPSLFTEKDMAKSYDIHLADIKKWCETNPTVTENLRKKWFRRSSQALGLARPVEESTNIDATHQEALRSEWEGRTGETDSEEEDDGDNDGPLRSDPGPIA